MVIQKSIVNLTSVWFVALRHARHLYMSALWSILAELDSQVPLHYLHMVEIHLQHQILCPHFLEDVISLGLRVEKEARHIACVDSLKQKGYSILGGFACADREVGNLASLPTR